MADKDPMTGPLTPEQTEALFKARFMIISMLRAIGVALMLAGMAVFAIPSIKGHELIGGIIFGVGAIQSIIIPRLMVRRWR